MEAQGADEQILKQSPWMHAWSDPVAGVTAYSQLMDLADLKDDGDHKLIIADYKQEIRIYQGTVVIFKSKIEDVPSGITTFYPNDQKPRIPIIAIAAGPYIYYFFEFKRYFRFMAPPIEPTEDEKRIWEKMRSGELSPEEGANQLSEVQKQGAHITSLSVELMALETVGEQKQLIDKNLDTNLQVQNYITCICSINKSFEEQKSQSRIVFGTENKHVYVLEGNGTKIMRKFELKSVPVKIAVMGIYDIDYRMAIACRDGKIYIIKSHNLMDKYLEVESMPVGICILDKHIMVASMEKVVTALTPRGKKMHSIYMTENIISMVPMVLQRAQIIQALIVGLENGEIRLYNEKQLITVIHAQEPLLGMKFGVYGREDGSLVLNYKNGGLSVKILQRQSRLSGIGGKMGPPAEQDVALPIPKKTKLFVQMTAREREQAQNMHRVFQKDLCRIRLKTAQEYIKILDDGNAPMAYSGGAKIRLNCQVTGLGPAFKIEVEVENTGKTPQYDIPVMVVYNPAIYKLGRTNHKIPLLVPGVTNKTEIGIESIHPSGAADLVRILVCSRESSVPLVAANIHMPMAEPEID